jgi:two-component system, OmpR family, response regulator
MRVLLVEDESEMRRAVLANLRSAGFIADAVGTVDEARSSVSIIRYGLVLLDRRLPDGDGLSLIPHVRRVQPWVPVILVSALDQIADKIRGLDMGADDYLTKPFDADELMARVRAALRRPGGEQTPPVLCGRLSFDLASREVIVAGQPLVLKRRELSLLEALMRRAGRVVLRDQLLEDVYGFDDDIQSNTLDAHISRLRGRLAKAQAGVVIHPVRGVGYCLDAA